MKVLYVSAGDIITNMAALACKIADDENDSVQFEFNETLLTVSPGRSPHDVVNEYFALRSPPANSDPVAAERERCISLALQYARHAETMQSNSTAAEFRSLASRIRSGE